MTDPKFYDPSVNDPIGVVLAGGLGRRIGGAKATIKLAGQPLISYPIDAVHRALGSVVVVAKRDSELPALPGITVWIEPDEPRHPLAGIVYALRCARGRAVLVCAGDLPLVGEWLVRALARVDGDAALAVVACSEGRLQPTLGCYAPGALPPLASALSCEGCTLSDAVRAIGPKLLEVDNPDELFNVNTPEDLRRAAEIFERSQSPLQS